VARLLKWPLKGFAIKDFTDYLENVLIQSSLARFTQLLIEWNTKLKGVLNRKWFIQSERKE